MHKSGREYYTMMCYQSRGKYSTGTEASFPARNTIVAKWKHVVTEPIWHPLYGTPLAVKKLSLMIKKQKRPFLGPIKHIILSLHWQFLSPVRDFAGNFHALVLCLFIQAVSHKLGHAPTTRVIRPAFKGTYLSEYIHYDPDRSQQKKYLDSFWYQL